MQLLRLSCTVIQLLLLAREVAVLLSKSNFAGVFECIQVYYCECAKGVSIL